MESFDDIAVPGKSMSNYEQIRLQNIKRNASFMASLGLSEIIAVPEQKRKPATRGKNKVPKRVAVPVRRSERVTVSRLQSELSNLNPDQEQALIEEKKAALAALNYQPSDYVAPQSEENMKTRHPPDPILLTSVDISGDQSGSPLQIEVLLGKSKASTTSAHSTIPPKKLILDETNVAKVTTSRITALYLHPGDTDRNVVFAGDKLGYVGIWESNNFTSDHEGVYRFKPHVANVAKIGSWDFNPLNIFTCSYDGTVRIIDMQKNAFVLAFQDSQDLHEVQYIDASTSNKFSNSLLVARSDGKISCIDLRASSKSYQFSYHLQDCKINSIQVHPTDPNYVIAAGSGKDGYISIHDVRVGKDQKKLAPIATMNEHSKSINAAYASPDGRAIVSVSQDNTIKTWSDFMSANANNCTTIRHDNFTGRWLSTFRPTFDPKNPSRFAMGSMLQPRRVELFEIAPISIFEPKLEGSKKRATSSKKESIYESNLEEVLASPYLNSVCSRNCFHDTKNVIACSNSSGRVHLFTEQQVL
jgi:WD40 repeat protein